MYSSSQTIEEASQEEVHRVINDKVEIKIEDLTNPDISMHDETVTAINKLGLNGLTLTNFKTE